MNGNINGIYVNGKTINKSDRLTKLLLIPSGGLFFHKVSIKTADR